MNTLHPFLLFSAVKEMAYFVWCKIRKITKLTLLLDSKNFCYSPCNLLLGVILDYAVIFVLRILKFLHRKPIFPSSNVESIS